MFAVTRFVEQYLLNSCKNEVNMNVQWYPGHMTKAKRQMQEDIKLIDLIIELVDSRVPLASRNPDIDELGKNKARLILLNKSDLGDERQNEAWKAYFQGKGFYVVKVDSRSGSGMKAIQAAIQEACREKTERDRRRGIKNRPIRAMVVGIPNVGKSTFINTFAGRACAKTGNSFYCKHHIICGMFLMAQTQFLHQRFLDRHGFTNMTCRPVTNLDDIFSFWFKGKILIKIIFYVILSSVFENVLK